nr:MAG TPA: hypothetical protein [Caudoviricetes sp.]
MAPRAGAIWNCERCLHWLRMLRVWRRRRGARTRRCR